MKKVGGAWERGYKGTSVQHFVLVPLRLINAKFVIFIDKIVPSPPSLPPSLPPSRVFTLCQPNIIEISQVFSLHICTLVKYWRYCEGLGMRGKQTIS